MKTTLKLIVTVVMIAAGVQLGYGQSSKSIRATQKKAEVDKMINDRSYVFKANFVNPQGGAGRALTSDYDLVVSKDTVNAFLPYFGRAYVAPYNATEGGIKFKTTNFDYKAHQNKNGSWDVIIKPKDRDVSDMRDVQTLQLSVTASGYAYLNVSSTNRDPISFNGYIQERSK